MASGGLGAGAAGADMLQEILQQKFREVLAKRQLAEQIRQADMQHQVQQQQLGQGQQRIGLESQKLGEDQRQFDVSSGQSGERLKMDQEAQPIRLRGIAAQAANLERQPQAEQAQRDYTTQRDKTQHTYRLGEIGAQNASPRNERIVQVQGPNGTPVWMRETEAVGKPAMQAPRAVTGGERQVLAYYNRAKDASETIAAPDKTGTSLEDRVAKGGIATQLGLQYAPNMLQSSDQQAYRQAQRAFTEARLRKESGAAIPTAEYDNDAKTYFAQPGDTPETINLKRQKRQTVLEGMKFSSGRAYQEFYGDEGGKPSGKPSAADLIKKYGG